MHLFICRSALHLVTALLIPAGAAVPEFNNKLAAHDGTVSDQLRDACATLNFTVPDTFVKPPD
jgi:hypothetical protein